MKKEDYDRIEEFLKRLRESAEIVFEIYTQGSCYQLFKILEALYPDAEPYWTENNGHLITKIGDRYYDIGGEINADHVNAVENGFKLVEPEQRHGYNLLRWLDKGSNRGVVTQMYNKKSIKSK